MMRVPLQWRCLSKSTMERYLSRQTAFVERGVGEPFAAENLRMDAGDQHLLIVGPVEDADPAPFRQIAGGAPEKIVLQFGGAGMFEAEYLTTLWVDPRHHMLDGAILPSRIHRLKDQRTA
jgi:hypothetical protein